MMLVARIDHRGGRARRGAEASRQRRVKVEERREHRSPASDRGRDAHPHRARRRGRFLRLFGKLCLTAAFILATYLAWVLWGTGFYTAREQDTLRRELTQRLQDPRAESATILPGNAYAIIKIPLDPGERRGRAGTDIESLQRGRVREETDDPGTTRAGWGCSGTGPRTAHRSGTWTRCNAGTSSRSFTEFGTFAYRVTRSKVIEPTQAASWIPQEAHACAHDLHAEVLRSTAAHRLRG